MGATWVPTFFALEFQGSYLRFTPREESREFHQFLAATGDSIVTPYTKFEAEACEKDPELFHLKSCFNNKYWVRQSETSRWIVAAADEIEEDQSKWSCTLFRPFTEYGLFKLRHVATRENVIINRNLQPYTQLGFRGNGADDGFSITDWASLVILPRFVAFKGDNGKYLSARVIQGGNHLQFASDSNDGSDPSVIHEVSHTPVGRVQFRSLRFNMYWINTNQWIFASSVDGSTTNTEFWQERRNINTIILRSFGVSFVCRRFTDVGRVDCLRAPDIQILRYSMLEFEECVKSREITEIEYRVQDVRFYDDRYVRADSVSARNYDENNDDTATLSYTFTKTISSTWSYSNSVTTGVTTSVKGRIPFIGKVGTELSISYTHTSESSETSEVSEQIQATYTATVPGGQMITIFGTLRQGSAYIPYSYTQVDTLFDDRKVETRKHDGVYHVTNGYDFYLSRTAPVPINPHLQ